MEENLITPTQDIAFAAMKDGSYIAHLKEGGKTSPMAISKIFGAMRKMIDGLDKEGLAIFSLVYIIESRMVGDALMRKVEEVKDED